MLVYLLLAGLLVLALPSPAEGGRGRLGFAIAAAACLTLFLARERGLLIWLLLAGDVAGVAVLGRLSWKAPRLWPIWMMGALGVGAAASLAYMLQPDVSEQTYARAMLLTRYAAVLALLLGARGKQASHS